MGLDVYVGSLTRYYSRDWETVVQKIGREQGWDVQIQRDYDPPESVTDPAEVQRIVMGWRGELAEALAEALTEPLDWDEGPEAPYFTDKPAFDCYSDLLLWAAYEEHPEFPRPETSTAKWWEDPAWQASNVEGFVTRYPNLLRGVEWWLPLDLPFVFTAPDPTGREAAFGSTVELERELEILNAQTWRANAETLAEWRAAGSAEGAPLERGARFGFAVFAHLVVQANAHRLVMKLDY